MSYTALYRKYRPIDFQGIIGQPVLVQTLKNAVTSGHISHAYLFSGPRGTGKTTSARVFAKAINCHFAKDGEPCNECETCVGINNGTLADYIEVDAASNNGVDEIRNIRSQIKYAPLVADYKIYVIDEAHMLSIGAFNALLKTLEEPPEYAVFILATTNPQKIPATIISRLQQYDFQRIRQSDIVKQLEYVLDNEKISYDKEALELIARLASGGMRDALSILDEVVTLDPKKVTLELVQELTGTTKRDQIFNFIRSAHLGDVKSIVQETKTIISEGKDLGQFIHELLVLIENILLFKNNIESGDFSKAELEKFKDYQNSWLFQVVDILNENDRLLRQTPYADILIEIMGIKLATLDLKKESVKDIEPIKIIEEKVQVKKAPIEQKPEIKPLSTDFNDLDKISKVLGSAKRSFLNQLNQTWIKVQNEADSELAAIIRYTHPVAAAEDSSVIAFQYPNFLNKLAYRVDLIAELRHLTGQKDIFGISEDEWPEFRKNYLSNLKKAPTFDNIPNDLTPNMKAIIKFLGPENVKIIED